VTTPIHEASRPDPDPPSRELLVLAERANVQNKAVLFDALAEARVHTLAVSFDGYGDSGQIESIEAFDAADQPIELPREREVVVLSRPNDHAPWQADKRRLREAVVTLVYEYLEATHMGWEDGEGAYGTFVFAVPERTVTLEHHQRFVDADTSIHTL
jgi:hypothetical protein